MSKRRELVESLASVDLFGRCSTGDLRIVARHAERRSMAAGTVVVTQGEPGDEFFLLLAGAATVIRDGVVVGALEAGNWFGELALLDPASRAATVTLTTDAELAVLGERMFKVLLRDLPAVGAAMLGALAARVRYFSLAMSEASHVEPGP